MRPPPRFSPCPTPGSLKGKSSRLRHAVGAELWRRFQRPLRDLQLWKALAQRLLDVTASLPDLPSVHTFLPQIEVTGVLPGGLAGASGTGTQSSMAFQSLSQGKACSWVLQTTGQSSVHRVWPRSPTCPGTVNTYLVQRSSSALG